MYTEKMFTNITISGFGVSQALGTKDVDLEVCGVTAECAGNSRALGTDHLVHILALPSTDRDTLDLLLSLLSNWGS